MEMERAFHMKTGLGEASYANNSLLQKKVIKRVKVILEEDMKLIMSNITLNGCIKVADLGCSSGPNALMAISNILNIIVKNSSGLNHGSIEFQIYLNDLFENDFNAMFKLLPDFHRSIQEEEYGKSVGACFINATPGTFYGRLFPSNFINFFHSSYGLHWLSQAPKDLTKKEEPLNKGNVYITKTSPPSVYDAYRMQFERDFKYFLESRFEELVWGGVMILTFIGTETTNEIPHTCEVLNMVLHEMVQEGLIEEEKMDLFDFPLYHPTIEEVREVIKSEGSFTLQTSKTFKIGWDADLQEDIVDYVLDSKMKGDFVAKYLRAVLEPLLVAVFGETIMDEFFSRFANMARQRIELGTPLDTNIVLIMTKNP